MNHDKPEKTVTHTYGPVGPGVTIVIESLLPDAPTEPASLAPIQSAQDTGLWVLLCLVAFGIGLAVGASL